MPQRETDPEALGGALNRLDDLLKQRQPSAPASAPRTQDAGLPILDDIVTDHAPPEATDAGEPGAFAAEQLSAALERLARQLELELEALAGLLKQSLQREFRKEIEKLKARSGNLKQ
jgi:hypothetical protein